MAGGTLLITREVKNHLYYKKRFETLGFRDVTYTALERDALNNLINDIKPKNLIMGARFYQCCTPFFMGELHKKFPDIKMAAVCIGEYPADLAMYFIINGVQSYVTMFDGVEQFYDGIDQIRRGKNYVSPGVVERIDMRKEYPMPAGNITERQREVIRLICCGFTEYEIGETLNISRKTVTRHKTEIFTTMNVRNPVELVISAMTQKIVGLDELYFYPRDYTLNPLPDRKIKNRGLVSNSASMPNLKLGVFGYPQADSF
jgi:DNA-binding NarL/FixJ family response regulator